MLRVTLTQTNMELRSYSLGKVELRITVKFETSALQLVCAGKSVKTKEDLEKLLWMQLPVEGFDLSMPKLSIFPTSQTPKPKPRQCTACPRIHKAGERIMKSPAQEMQP